MSRFIERLPSSNVVSAGRSGYRLNLYIQDNPYRIYGRRLSDLWEKGYRLERRKWEGPPQQVLSFPRPQPVQSQPKPTQQPQQSQHPQAQQKPVRRTYSSSQKVTPLMDTRAKKPVQKATSEVLDPRRLANFNQRHRTAA